MPWQRVAVVVAASSAAALAEALEAEGAVSVEISDARAGTAGERSIFGEPGSDDALWPYCRVSALFEEREDASAAFDRALEASATPSLEAASIDRLQDADWVAQAQRQFTPLQVGARLWIVPSWHDAPDPAAVNIILDPGAAFGTGSNPTTRLCLAWLERNVRIGDRVLDYGCGSGILGIAALRLGAASATAVDIDPLALESARYNATRNGVALEVASAGRSLTTHARLTVANILANPLRMLAPLLATHTEPRGRIALAGILESQASEVADAYAPWAALAVESSAEGWVLLAGERRS